MRDAAGPGRGCWSASRLRRVTQSFTPNPEFTLRLLTIPPAPGPTLAVHGGAGAQPWLLTDAQRERVREGLRESLAAGQDVLAEGGSADEAVCAAVRVLEDNEMFNAGRGAALTADGTAELDACLMWGDGRCGAVTGCTNARHPVDAARAVADHSPHVFLVAPPVELLREWGVDVESPDYFVTPRQQEALERVRRTREVSHGTVGAVARDAQGRLAAATSTGGMTNKMVGRVGDTPLPGAGTFAADGVAAVSGTGEGEYFMRGVFAHDIAARVRYAAASLTDAVAGSVTEALTERGGTGGAVAVGADGTVVVASNSEAMYEAHLDATGQPQIGW